MSAIIFSDPQQNSTIKHITCTWGYIFTAESNLLVFGKEGTANKKSIVLMDG